MSGSRSNDCPNPALAVSATGCFGGSRVTVSDLPSPDGVTRGRAYRISLAADAVLPEVAATAGETRNHSVWACARGGNATIVMWQQSYAGGTFVDSPSTVTTFTLPEGQWVRCDWTRAVAAGGTRMRSVVRAAGSAASVDLSLFLFEGEPSLDSVPTPPGTYFDGDSPGAEWDGAGGASSSTLTTVVSIPAGRTGFLQNPNAVGVNPVLAGGAATGWSHSGSVISAQVVPVTDHVWAQYAYEVTASPGRVFVDFPRLTLPNDDQNWNPGLSYNIQCDQPLPPWQEATRYYDSDGVLMDDGDPGYYSSYDPVGPYPPASGPIGVGPAVAHWILVGGAAQPSPPPVPGFPVPPRPAAVEQTLVLDCYQQTTFRVTAAQWMIADPVQ